MDYYTIREKISNIEEAGKDATDALNDANAAMTRALLGDPFSCSNAQKVLDEARSVYIHLENRYYWLTIYGVTRRIGTLADNVPEDVAARMTPVGLSCFRINDFHRAAGMYALLGTQDALNDVMRCPVFPEDLGGITADLMDFIAAAI